MTLRSIYLISAVVLLMSLFCDAKFTSCSIRFRASVCILAGISSACPLDCGAIVPDDIQIQQIKEDNYAYAAEMRMLEAESQRTSMSPLGAPGNSIAEDLIGLVFKSLGTYRGEGMDDLKGGNKGEGAFYTVPKEK